MTDKELIEKIEQIKSIEDLQEVGKCFEDINFKINYDVLKAFNRYGLAKMKEVRDEVIASDYPRKEILVSKINELEIVMKKVVN